MGSLVLLTSENRNFGTDFTIRSHLLWWTFHGRLCYDIMHPVQVLEKVGLVGRAVRLRGIFLRHCIARLHDDPSPRGLRDMYDNWEESSQHGIV